MMSRSGIALVLLVVACVVLQARTRANAVAHKLETETYEHVFYVPPPTLLKLLSFGQREALADLLWSRALIYLGEESIRNLSADHIFDYGRAVVALDPYFARAYRVFAINAQSRPGLNEAETLARIRASIAFLEEGVKVLPDDGELAWDTGSLYAHTLAPRLGHDEKAYWEAKRRGVEHMQAATLRGFGPPWAGVANASALIRLGQTELAIVHLQEIYAITSDPDVKAEIEATLAQLRSQAFIEGLKQVSLELSKNHLRDFPYASETMYLLLGRRPLVNRSALLAASFDPAFVSAPADDDVQTR